MQRMEQDKSVKSKEQSEANKLQAEADKITEETLLNKMGMLVEILEAQEIDVDKSIGSETIYVSLLSAKNRGVIETKLMELVNKL